MKSHDIINQLENTTSLNEKKSILTNLPEDLVANIKFIFLWTYSPRLNYYVKKIDRSRISLGKLDFDSEINKDSENEILELLQDLSERKVTGNAAIDRVHKVLSLFDEPSRELIIKMLLRDLRCGVTDTIANKVWPNWIPTFEVQLANTFDPEKPKEKSFWVSRKMDGLRGIYIPGEGLFTRGGKKLIGFEDTIEKDLADFTSKTGYSVDGELFTTEIPFDEIQGAVMSNKNIDEEVKKKIKFFTFGLVKNFWQREIFKATVDMVNDLLGVKGYPYLQLVEYRLIDVSEVDKVHDEFVAEGYEGIMLRSPNVSYEFKRGNGLFKYKKFIESDFEIVGIYEGQGKYEGKLGGMSIRGEAFGRIIETDMGSGFTDEQRVKYFDLNLIGKMVEVKYQGLTKGNSLRFPTVNKLKLDR